MRSLNNFSHFVSNKLSALREINFDDMSFISVIVIDEYMLNYCLKRNSSNVTFSRNRI